jgi:predicted RNase H-like HicB family nuclease
MKYLVVFEKAEGNFGAYLPDLPGCVAVGDTREEVERSIREAVEFHLESIQEHDEAIPAPAAWAMEIDIDVPAQAPKKSA